LKVYDVMQVTRTTNADGTESKPVWSLYEGPFWTHIQAEGECAILNEEKNAIKVDTATKSRTRIFYQLKKRNATAEELVDIADYEAELRAEYLQEEEEEALEASKKEKEEEEEETATIVKPKGKKKQTKKELRTFLTIKPQTKEGEKCPEIQTAY
jgi:hypothetical protein